MPGSIELVVMVFDDEARAGKSLKTLKKLQKENSIRLFNAAVLVKTKAGLTSFQETQDVDTKHGAVFGAIVGGLVGLLGGPAGAIVGAVAGAATGGVTANLMDLGFSDDFLREVTAAIKPGSSAIIVIVEQVWVEHIVKELENLKGRLLRHALKADLAEQLKKEKND